MLIFIIILSLIGGWLGYASGNAHFFSAAIEAYGIICKIVAITVTVYMLLYLPCIWLIRKWWQYKKTKNTNSQTAKGIDKFIANTNALIGSITIFYAIFVFLFGHIIAPDITPYANDQINEIAFKPPGFSITILKQPLSIKPKKTNFIQWLTIGKQINYKSTPITQYYFSDDSIYVERYIGDSIQGQMLAFKTSYITGQNISDAENKTLIEDSYIGKRNFLLGTDDLGRDYLSRIIMGVRVSLSVGIIAVLIALVIGIPAGAFAGFYKKHPPYITTHIRKQRKIKLPLDDMIMWLINIIWAIPTLLLVFPIVFAFGQNFYTIFIAVGLTMWVDIARIVRGQVMSIRELEYIQATKAFGYSDMRVIFKHILPNISGPVIVITAANFAYAILTEAGLSFLGIGVQPPAPSWGLMISKYKDNLITDPYLALIPGFAITLLVLAFFMVGNGLRDALDVKTKIEY